jgi:hypothetical protein
MIMKGEVHGMFKHLEVKEVEGISIQKKKYAPLLYPRISSI